MAQKLHVLLGFDIRHTKKKKTPFLAQHRLNMPQKGPKTKGLFLSLAFVNQGLMIPTSKEHQPDWEATELGGKRRQTSQEPKSTSQTGRQMNWVIGVGWIGVAGSESIRLDRDGIWVATLRATAITPSVPSAPPAPTKKH